MSKVICIVCREGLEFGPAVDSQESSSGSLDRRICTTQCGHVMHLHCINIWWKTIAEDQASRSQQSRTWINGYFYYPASAAATHGTTVTTFTCPLCGSTVTKPVVFELFLSFVDSDSEPGLLQVEAERDELKKQVEDLSAKNASLLDLLKEHEPEREP